MKVDLGEIISNLGESDEQQSDDTSKQTKEKTEGVAANDEQSTADQDKKEQEQTSRLLRVLSDLSGSVTLAIKKDSAMISLTDRVLHTALVSLNVEDYFPKTLQGVTNLSNEYTKEIPEGEYIVSLDYDGFESESFAYTHSYLRNDYALDLTDCDVRSIVIDDKITLSYKAEWEDYFEIDKAKGTIRWTSKTSEKFAELSLGEHHCTDGYQR